MALSTHGKPAAVSWEMDASENHLSGKPVDEHSSVSNQFLKIAAGFPAAALFLLLFLPSRVNAQTSHVSSPYETGNGIKVGEGRLHPYFDFELHYDSAAGYFGGGGTSALTLKPEAIAHFRPGLRLDVPAPTATFNLDGNVDYLWYTGLITKGSSSASRLQAAVDTNAGFNQGGSVEFDIGDHFARSDRTQNVAVGVGVLSLFNDAHASLPLRPGGHALEIVPNVGWSLESFKSISSILPPGCTDPSCDPTTMNYQNLRFGLDARWRFLPKTAFTFDSRFDTRNYSNSTANPSAKLLKASLGLAGLVSTKVAVALKVGWGQDFSNTGLHTIIALAELNYLISETSNVKFGYLRNVEPVPTYGTYRDDRGYIDTRFFLNGRLTLHGSAAFDSLTFYSGTTRSDTAVTFDIGPEYQFARWLLGAAGYVLGTRGSNVNISSLNFTRNEAYVRVTFIY